MFFMLNYSIINFLLLALMVFTIILTQRITKEDPANTYPALSRWIIRNFGAIGIILIPTSFLLFGFVGWFSSIVWMFVLFIFSLVVPFHLYGYLFKRLPNRILQYIVMINIGLNTLVIYDITGMRYGYMSHQPFNVYSEDIFSAFIVVLVLNLFAHGILYIIAWLFGANDKKSFVKPYKRSRQTKDMTKHYEDLGMTAEEIESFREYMSEARDYIYQVEDNINKSARLRTIAANHNTIEVMQGYFKSIVHEANRQHEASDFLFKYLPNIADLSSKYNEVNGHVAKNKQTYILLDRTAQAIDQVAQEITNDYLTFHKHTFDQLDEELAYTERILNKNQQTPNTTIDDVFNDLERKEDNNDEFEF